MSKFIKIPTQSIAGKIFQIKDLPLPRICLRNDFISDKMIICDSSPRVTFMYQQINLNTEYNLTNITTIIQNIYEFENNKITENIKIYTPITPEINTLIKYNIFYNLDILYEGQERGGYYHIHNKCKNDCDENYIYNEFLKYSENNIEPWIGNAIDKISNETK